MSTREWNEENTPMAACVWYISKYVLPPAPGDPPSRGYGIMRAMARLGHAVTIITSDSMGMLDTPEAPHRYSFQARDGLSFWQIRTLKYRSSKSVRRVLSWLDFELKLLRFPTKALARPDAIIVSSLSLLTILNGLRLKRKFGSRLIFEVRDIWPLTLVEESAIGARNPLVRLLAAIERLGYERSDAIVGTMPNLSEHVRSTTSAAPLVHCIPMGIDPTFASAGTPLPADYAAAIFPTDRFVVAYAGSIGIANALDALFECAQSMASERGVHFVVLGDGGLRDKYAQRYGGLPNVTFAPKVPKAMVNDFLRRCDLLYLATANAKRWDYGWSLNKIIDYMLAAKPVLASYSGYRSMINEADCGSFVPSSNADAIAAEIRRYAAMPAEERERIGRRGREWVLTHRDFASLADAYLKIALPSSSNAETA